MKAPTYRITAFHLLALLTVPVAPSFADLLVSEIHTAGYEGNDPVLTDNDWIELHNSGSIAIPLSGYALTDSATRTSTWPLPAISLPAGSYLILLANGNNVFDPFSGYYQTSFSLNNGGEYLALIDPVGTAISEINPGFPAQFYGHTYGIPQGETAYAYLATPTPGEANTVIGYSGKCTEPVFSSPRGFYENSFQLTLSRSDPEAQIRFTLDGSWPDAVTGTLYTSAIPVSGTTLLKAITVREGYLSSEPVTHTYIFGEDVFSQPDAPAGFPSVWGTQQIPDYGMSSSITKNRRYTNLLPLGLADIPSISVVMDQEELFGTEGLWGNAEERGDEWERMISIEFITGDPDAMFQENAGMRMSGGAARGIENPKHPFRIYFRKNYGTGKLDYPVFSESTFKGEEAVDQFDVLLLRGVMNYSWIQSSNWFASQALYFRDLWVADAQLAMGHPSTHGRPVNLFLNGLYWGVYILQEQVDATFASDYMGGSKDEWDVVKHFIVKDMPNQDIYEVKDGDGAAWDTAQQVAQLDMSLDFNYEKLAQYIDIDNHIDYMILNIYAANSDGVVIRETEGNNWYGARKRSEGEGFKFINWDAEFSLVNPNEDKSDMHGTNNPATYYAALRGNKEWRVRFGDRVHYQMLNGGPLSEEKNIERFLYRRNQFLNPIVLESARWGDHGGPEYTLVNWTSTVNKVLNQFFPVRTNFVLDLFKADGLYPTIGAPVFSQHGGEVPFGYALEMAIPDGATGTIYYTMDGSDPRLKGGSINPGALAYTTSLSIQRPMILSSRTWQDGEWSALNQAQFVLDQNYGDVKVSEFHYHPTSFNAIDGDEFEFIELVNAGFTALDLDGISFTDGIEFTFPAGFTLDPGGIVLLVSNAIAFAQLHPGIPVDGTYLGKLRNSGERLALSLANGTEFFAMSYRDAPPWPTEADGDGYSLEAISLTGNGDPSSAAYWKLSEDLGGSPGTHSLSNPVLDFFLGAVVHENGWVYDDWLGYFNATEFPWIYHVSNHWLYVARKAGESDVWLYDLQLGWIYYTPASAGWFYLPDQSTWVSIP